MENKTKHRKRLSEVGIRILTLLLLISVSGIAWAETVVKGSVADKAGEPLIGATVAEKGVFGNGVFTDMDGNFSIKVKNDNSTIVVSYIGFLT